MSLPAKKASQQKKAELSINRTARIPQLRCFEMYRITIGTLVNDGSTPISFDSEHGDLERHAQEYFGDKLERCTRSFPATSVIAILKSGKRHVIRKGRLTL